MALLSVARPSTRFWTYAALAGRDLAIVFEIPGGGAATDSWADGVDLQALAETADGEVIGRARQKLSTGARGIVVHVPLDAVGRPATLRIQVQHGRSSASWRWRRSRAARPCRARRERGRRHRT